MDTTTPEKRAKSTDKKWNYSTMRLRKEIAKRFNAEIGKLNEKRQGRRVRPDELIAHLLTLLDDSGRRKLQEATMSNSDLIERDYQEYCATHEKIGKDEYLGLLRRKGITEPAQGQSAQ